MKTERTQIHFLSDVLVAVASWDLKVVRKHGYHNMCTMDAHVDETCALIHRRYNIINKKVKLPILRWIKTSNYVKSVE